MRMDRLHEFFFIFSRLLIHSIIRPKRHSYGDADSVSKLIILIILEPITMSEPITEHIPENFGGSRNRFRRNFHFAHHYLEATSLY